MDFFQSQDQARKRTLWLVVMFVVSVSCMILALYAAVVFSLNIAYGKSDVIRWFQPAIFGYVSGITALIVITGSLYKVAVLSAGGEAVATSLGGTLINEGTTDPSERQVLNVVEEMAIASGVAVPPVYILRRERSINAFAAGLTPDDAVIGISRGTVELLDRDELQGVIAHEFSHILNGDMRFNLRLMAVLHGILLISLIGYYILRFGGGGSRDSKGQAPVLLIGLAAFVIGSFGLFFSRLIKAAVSRQREYLADASAVQFTRNPNGISGALKKIGGLLDGSQIRSPEAETASHMFFGSAFSNHAFAFNPFATHPPLLARIQRIDPNFDGSFPKVSSLDPLSSESTRAIRRAQPKTTNQGFQLRPQTRLPFDPVAVVAAIGLPSMEHVAYAQALVGQLPDRIRSELQNPFGAMTVVYALLLDRDEQFRKPQLDLLEQHNIEIRHATESVWSSVVSLERQHWLPVLEIAQGTLRSLTSSQYTTFRTACNELIEADQRINLFEFALRRCVLLHLDRVFGFAKPPIAKYHSTVGVANEVELVLSALTHLGRMSKEEEANGFLSAFAHFDHKLQVRLRPRAECRLADLEKALDKLAACSPALKKRIITAASACVAYDNTVTAAEAELLRSISASLDCPMPPVVPGSIQKPA